MEDDFLTRRYMPDVDGRVNEKARQVRESFSMLIELGSPFSGPSGFRTQKHTPRRKKAIVHEPRKLEVNWARSSEWFGPAESIATIISPNKQYPDSPAALNS
jgi:hypothetical protein